MPRRREKKAGSPDGRRTAWGDRWGICWGPGVGRAGGGLAPFFVGVLAGVRGGLGVGEPDLKLNVNVLPDAGGGSTGSSSLSVSILNGEGLAASPSGQGPVW